MNLLPWLRGLRPASGSYSSAPQIVNVSPTSARSSGGATITLTGYEFKNNGNGSAPSVTVGGVAATGVTVIDPYTLTFTMPVVSFVGIVDIVVTTSGGSDTLSGIFNVYASTLSAVSPAFGPIAGGYAATITGFNFASGSTFTFGGVAATGVTFLDNEHYVVTVPAHGKGFVDVIITDSGGATFTLKGGFQYTLLVRGEDFRRQPGITINDSLNNTPNTCDFTVDGDSNIPIEGEEIQVVDVFDSNRLLFAGTVQSVDQVFEGLTDQLAFNVRCVDFTFLLNKYRPFGKFIGVSASDIVRTLIQKFAPDFGTDFVQTKLARVTHEFDGTRDLATCLSEVAASIGGGHWYVDYDRQIHFFHVVPPGAVLPDFPETSLASVFSTAMVAAEGADIPSTFSFKPGFYRFASTIYYDNNVESALSPWSNWVYLTGTKQVALTSIPTGSVIGAFTPSKRRIYMNAMTRQLIGSPGGNLDKIDQYAQIDNNTDTSLTSWFKDTGAPAGVVNIPGTEAIPRKPTAGHPAAPTSAPSLSIVPGGNGSITLQVRVAYTYRNGSTSYASPASATARILSTPGVAGTGALSIQISNIPTGPTVDGVDVTGRVIYHGWSSEALKKLTYQSPSLSWDAVVKLLALEPDWTPPAVWGVYIIPDNTTTTFTLEQQGQPIHSPQARHGDNNTPANLPYYKAGQGTVFEDEPIPVWPNDDGPWLEDTERPDDIDANNTDLLYNPQITRSVDLSQVRNRIYVFGRGSVLTQNASVGDTSLFIADPNAFSQMGGTLNLNGEAYTYTEILGTDGVWEIGILEPLREPAEAGDQVNNFMQLDDVESQKALAKIELLKNGSKSDGVHEYTIVDTTLKAKFQLFTRGQAELELFARPIITVNYSTRDPKSRSGRLVTINLTTPPISGEFLIQNITIDQIHDESDQLSPRYNVRASSVKFDLSDLLLQMLQKQNVIAGAGGGSSSIGIGKAVIETTVGALEVRYATIILTPAMLIDMQDTGSFLDHAVEIAPAPGEGKYNCWFWMAVEKRTEAGDNTASGHSLILRTQNPATAYVTFGLGLNNTNRSFQFRGNDPAGIGIRTGTTDGFIDGENEPLYLIRDTGAIVGFVATDDSPIVKVTLCYTIVGLNTDLPPYVP